MAKHSKECFSLYTHTLGLLRELYVCTSFAVHTFGREENYEKSGRGLKRSLHVKIEFSFFLIKGLNMMSLLIRKW